MADVAGPAHVTGMATTTEPADWPAESVAESVEDNAGPVHVEDVSATGAGESEAEETARSSAAEADPGPETEAPEIAPETAKTE